MDAEEADLWPAVRAALAARSRPADIIAIYPHRQAVPCETWLALFGSAVREIGILDCGGLFLAQDAGILDTLASQAEAGVRVRICLRDPSGSLVVNRGATDGAGATATGETCDALALYGRLHGSGTVEIRLHRVGLYNSIYRADDQLLVSQHAHGIPDARAPVLHLRPADGGEMIATYFESFDRIWVRAIPLD